MNWFRPALMATALISLIADPANAQGLDLAFSRLIVEAESRMGINAHCFVIDAAINYDDIFARNHSIRERDIVKRGASVSSNGIVLVRIERFREDNSANGPIVLAKAGIRIVDYDLLCRFGEVPTFVGPNPDIHIDVNEKRWRFAEVAMEDRWPDFFADCNAIGKCGLAGAKPSTLLNGQRVSGDLSNSLCRFGLLDGRCDYLVGLRGGRPHFFQLGFGNAHTVSGYVESGESDKGRNGAGDGGNPLWKIQIWEYSAAALLGACSFALMLFAYFWLLFAVAVPKGIKFGWWFDKYNVHLWSPRRRGVVALALFLISVTLIITAVRLALPHRNLPTSHPLNQISSIRTV